MTRADSQRACRHCAKATVVTSPWHIDMPEARHVRQSAKYQRAYLYDEHVFMGTEGLSASYIEERYSRTVSLLLGLPLYAKAWLT